MERNKILEEAKKNDIHQEYFPAEAQTTTPSGSTRATQHSGSHPPIIHNHYAPSPCLQQCKHEITCNNKTCIDDLKTSLDMLKILVENLTATLPHSSSLHPGPPHPAPPHPAPPHPSPPHTSQLDNHYSSEQIPADPSLCNSSPLPAVESSIITLDGFMFDEEGADMDLN